MMKVDGIEIPQHLIDHAFLGVNPNGFTAAELEASMEAAGIAGLATMRCADRSLQKARKAGKIEYVGGKWRASKSL